MEYYGGTIIANSDLYHHGILGQRWGRRNGPPYPLDGPDHSSSERKAGWRKSLGGGSFKRKKKKQKNVDAEAIAKERLKTLQTENPSLYEAEKQTALKKGKASDVLKFQGDLTNQQLQDAITRIEREQKLSDYSLKEVRTNWDKIDDVMNKVQKITNWTNTSLNAYSAAEKVYKKIYGIDDGNDDSNKDKKK